MLLGMMTILGVPTKSFCIPHAYSLLCNTPTVEQVVAHDLSKSSPGETKWTSNGQNHFQKEYGAAFGGLLRLV